MQVKSLPYWSGVGILNNQTILDYSSNCLEVNGYDEDKCISRSEFENQKEKIITETDFNGELKYCEKATSYEINGVGMKKEITL